MQLLYRKWNSTFCFDSKLSSRIIKQSSIENKWAVPILKIGPIVFLGTTQLQKALLSSYLPEPSDGSKQYVCCTSVRTDKLAARQTIEGEYEAIFIHLIKKDNCASAKKIQIEDRDLSIKHWYCAVANSSIGATIKVNGSTRQRNCKQ